MTGTAATELSDDVFGELVDSARLAPTVHNIQPARWQRNGASSFLLLGDMSRRIPAADPGGRDWRLSIGAHFEGLALAASDRGLTAHFETISDHNDAAPLEPQFAAIGEVRLSPRVNAPAPHGLPIAGRTSFRGAFEAVGKDDNLAASLERLKSLRDDCLVIDNREQVGAIANWADEAALHFLRDDEHRRELLAWMRLSKAHPNYDRDGLSREALALSFPEAIGARWVLGPAFSILDRLGLAAPLLSERAKTARAAAVVLFHRPAGEDAFASGRAFYRAWLAMESCGLIGCPVSVLADWTTTKARLMSRPDFPRQRELVSVFRLGRPARARKRHRSRLSVAELILPQ